MVRPLFTQALGNLQAIETVYPMKVFSDGPRLVGLDGTDKMPTNGLIHQCSNLGQGILQVAFAKILLAGGQGLFNILDWPGFAHCQQGHCTCRSPVAVFGICDLCTDLIQAFCERIHLAYLFDWGYLKLDFRNGQGIPISSNDIITIKYPDYLNIAII